jgi:hypothetical protein
MREYLSIIGSPRTFGEWPSIWMQGELRHALEEGICGLVT